MNREATNDDVVSSIESLDVRLESIVNKMPESDAIGGISSSLVRIEELLERIVEALAPDGKSP